MRSFVVLGLLAVGAFPALADTIEINTLLSNGSFEVNGGVGSCPTSWTCGGSPGAEVYEPGSSQYTPGSDGLSSGSTPAGQWVADLPSGLSGSGTLSQMTNTLWVAGDNYTFTFEVGVPKTEPNGTTVVVGAPTTLRIMFTENGVLDGLPEYDIVAPAVGQWEQVQFSVSAAQLASSGATGQKLGVEFFASGTNNQEVNFDAVPPAVPEPTSVALLATILMAVAWAAHKRHARTS